MIDTDRTGVTREPDAAVLSVLLAWESGTITVEQACRALGLSREALFALEVEAIGRGMDIVRKAAAK